MRTLFVACMLALCVPGWCALPDNCESLEVLAVGAPEVEVYATINKLLGAPIAWVEAPKMPVGLKVLAFHYRPEERLMLVMYCYEGRFIQAEIFPQDGKLERPRKDYKRLNPMNKRHPYGYILGICRGKASLTNLVHDKGA